MILRQKAAFKRSTDHPPHSKESVLSKLFGKSSSVDVINVEISKMSICLKLHLKYEFKLRGVIPLTPFAWWHFPNISRQSRRRVYWGLFHCSKHLCNDVVAYVIISPLGSPPLYKQAELMSPSGYEDKDRHPLDSLTLDSLSYLLYGAIKAATAFIPAAIWNRQAKGVCGTRRHEHMKRSLQVYSTQLNDRKWD